MQQPIENNDGPDSLDAAFDHGEAAANILDAAIQRPEQQRDALDAIQEIAGYLGACVQKINPPSLSASRYGDPERGDERHAATVEVMRDLTAAVTNASEREEAAAIVDAVLSSVRELTDALYEWTGAPARAANSLSLRAGLTRDQVLERLEAAGRKIQPGTWSSYVARGQAPQPARRLNRTPLWDPADIDAVVAGTWKP